GPSGFDEERRVFDRERREVPNPVRDPPSDAPPEQVGFLLLPQFPIYALILALETLRIADQNAGRRLFSTHLFSLDGKPVRATNGMELKPDRAIREVPFFPTVLVFAGNEPLPHLTRPLLGWLRRLARHGAVLGAVDTGAFALAEAGLLDGVRVTLHWEAIPLFRERYPGLEVVERLSVLERNRMSCAGGIATFDPMLELVRARAGAELAEVVRAGLVHKRARLAHEPQRPPIAAVPGPLDPRLEAAVRLIERHLDQPLPPEEFARRVGLSLRQLQRLAKARLGESPTALALRLRLVAARNHLFYGDLSIQEIAVATRFAAPSVFSRCFKARFGLAPREFRRQFSGDRLERFRPEIRQELALPSPEDQRPAGGLRSWARSPSIAIRRAIARIRTSSAAARRSRACSPARRAGRSCCIRPSIRRSATRSSARPTRASVGRPRSPSRAPTGRGSSAPV
ncbi:MAG: GlxA family transcriptional regulator, partial [Geminicoccaceae bacterium]|nr:GlxA family transcriptional regulator [Geminicoccaceae bacterium]